MHTLGMQCVSKEVSWPSTGVSRPATSPSSSRVDARRRLGGAATWAKASNGGWANVSERVEFETIELERDDTVAVIRLNRPEKLNSFSSQMVKDICDALDQLAEDDD